MRVLVLSPTADLYGSTLSMLETLDVLGAERVGAHWAIPTDGPLAAELRSRNTPYHLLPALRVARAGDSRAKRLARLGHRLPTGSLEVSRLARATAANLIHSNSAAVLAGAYGSRLAGVPHLWHVREMIPQAGSFSLALRHEIGARSEAVVCVSRAVANQLGSRLEPRVIPDGIQKERLGHTLVEGARESFAIPRGALVVGCSGYLNPRKGMDLLLEAYALGRRHAACPTRLLLAGDPYPGHEGFREALLDRAKELGLEDELILSGYVSDISRFLAAIDIFALVPREPEGLGRSLLEAMASGVASVGAAEGGILDVIVDGRSGLLVPPRDVGATAEALRSLLTDSAMRRRLAESGRQTTRAAFNLERTSGKLLSVYEELAA